MNCAISAFPSFFKALHFMLDVPEGTECKDYGNYHSVTWTTIDDTITLWYQSDKTNWFRAEIAPNWYGPVHTDLIRDPATGRIFFRRRATEPTFCRAAEPIKLLKYIYNASDTHPLRVEDVIGRNYLPRNKIAPKRNHYNKVAINRNRPPHGKIFVHRNRHRFGSQ